MKGTNVLLLLISFLLIGCGKEQMPPSEYVQWINNPENGIVKEKTIHPLTVELLYKTIDYVIANEFRSDAIPVDAYNQKAAELEGMQYYTLKLGIVDERFDVTNYEVEDEAQQQDRLSYLSFAMQKAIKLVEGKDTLACKLYHFERSYDLSPKRTFVLGFDAKEANKTKDKTFILDLPFFRTGPIKINYKQTDLEQIPDLKL